MRGSTTEKSGMQLSFRFSNMRIRTKMLAVIALFVAVFFMIVLTMVVSPPRRFCRRPTVWYPPRAPRCASLAKTSIDRRSPASGRALPYASNAVTRPGLLSVWPNADVLVVATTENQIHTWIAGRPAHSHLPSMPALQAWVSSRYPCCYNRQIVLHHEAQIKAARRPCGLAGGV